MWKTPALAAQRPRLGSSTPSQLPNWSSSIWQFSVTECRESHFPKCSKSTKVKQDRGLTREHYGLTCVLPLWSSSVQPLPPSQSFPDLTAVAQERGVPNQQVESACLASYFVFGFFFWVSCTLSPVFQHCDPLYLDISPSLSIQPLVGGYHRVLISWLRRFSR